MTHLNEILSPLISVGVVNIMHLLYSKLENRYAKESSASATVTRQAVELGLRGPKQKVSPAAQPAAGAV